jgi:hypothetical protein
VHLFHSSLHMSECLSFYFTRTLKGLNFVPCKGILLSVPLLAKAVLPGISPSQRSGREAEGFHKVHNLKGNKLFRGCIVIPETKPGKFLPWVSRRRGLPNLNLLAFYCGQEVDAGATGSTKSPRHELPSESLESEFWLKSSSSTLLLSIYTGF